jgi:mono/diheme cytochrome c family protein
MQLTTTRTILSAAALIFFSSGLGRAVSTPPDSQDQKSTGSTPIQRGGYLVGAMGCNDCHTPWKLGPKGPEPDMSRELSGHPADLVMPPAPKPSGPWTWSGGVTNTAFAGQWGTSFTANLTPDAETGLGKWTAETFIATLRTGRHEGKGRPILPPMPWPMIRTLTDEDLRAVFAYLQSLPPIRNRVPAPVDPEDQQ